MWPHNFKIVVGEVKETTIVTEIFDPQKKCKGQAYRFDTEFKKMEDTGLLAYDKATHILTI